MDDGRWTMDDWSWSQRRCQPKADCTAKYEQKPQPVATYQPQPHLQRRQPDRTARAHIVEIFQRKEPLRFTPRLLQEPCRVGKNRRRAMCAGQLLPRRTVITQRVQ